MNLLTWGLCSGIWRPVTGDGCPTFRDSVVHSDHWRRDHHAVSKRRTPITQWFGDISQKNEDLKPTAAKA